MSKDKTTDAFRTSIGGQALIEGVMMRGPRLMAAVVNTPGGIEEKVEELKLIKDRYPVLGAPFVRGIVNFIDSMVKGMSMLTWSAELTPEDDDGTEPDKLDLWIERKFGWEKAQKIAIGIAVILGICLSVGLFILLPTVLAGLMGGFIKTAIWRNLAEGALRILIFLGYLWGISRLKDVRRLFAYHGAEHKTIHCYEKRLPLTVENVSLQSTRHPRCGTSFLFVVMLVSILVFSVVSWTNTWVRLGMRLLLLPVVVGISYEINRAVGRHDNALTRFVSAPGRALQALTTSEPDESMIKAAIRALTLVIPEEEGADAW